MQPIHLALKTVEEQLREGNLTPAKEVDEGTFICFTEPHPQVGFLYHQFPFEKLPTEIQSVFKGAKKGEIVCQFKIVAVFDTWDTWRKKTNKSDKSKIN